MHFAFEFAKGSELFVVMLVEHQVTLSQDFFFPLVQKTSGARWSQRSQLKYIFKCSPAFSSPALDLETKSLLVLKNLLMH
jgi:hypothetical protein